MHAPAISWEFSLANAIFSSILFICVPIVLWVKLKRQRLAIEAGMLAFREEIAPITAALQKLGSGFIIEKVAELEGDVRLIAARLEHIERLLESSQQSP